MSIFIIAEIGSVHDGSFGNAKQSVLMAKECGVDAIKFQVHIAEAETTRNAPSPSYFKSEPRWEYFCRTGFSVNQWKELKKLCDKTGIEFMASPFSEDAVELLHGIGMKIWKIPSGEMTNVPMLRKIAGYGQPVILSSGMSAWGELDQAVAAIRKTNKRCEITILQCTSEYPCPYERVGLNVMEQMTARYKVPVGLSDHTLDIFAPIVAVSRGAAVIEKHVTFSRKMYGSDARHSLEPAEFARMVEGVRAADRILSCPVDKDKLLKRYSDMKRIFQKSIVAKTAIAKGTKIAKDMVTYKKPGTGLSAASPEAVVGKTIRKDVKADHLFSSGDFK